MNKIVIEKISYFSEVHFTFLKKVYFANNSTEDSEEGNTTFIDFVSIEKCNNRIKEGSLFYELIIDEDLVGIFEIEENHITLLYIDTDFQKSGLGTFCIDKIKNILQENYSEITVFASPYSLDFYLKKGFVKQSQSQKKIKGMSYYPMSLNI